MQIDKERIKTFLNHIIKESESIKTVLIQSDDEILKSSRDVSSLKYSIIIISEAMINTIQHVLAKRYSVAVTGYKQAFIKAKGYKIISENLFRNLQPFIGFRSMLIHQYGEVDDQLFLNNLRAGLKDFTDFANEMNRLIVNSSDENES